MSDPDETDSDSETSPTTQRWNRIKRQLDSTVPANKEELRNKLKQKLFLENTRRLSRYGQTNKLEMMKATVQAKAQEEVEETQKKELSEKKREKNKKRREAYRAKQRREKELAQEPIT